MFSNIVATAVKYGRLPCEVWEQYEAHPEDFFYMWSFQSWQNSEEEKRFKAENKG